MTDPTSLTNGGDCFLHWHSEDRTPTADFLHGLQSLAKVREVSSDYTIKPSDDFILVSAAATITLPQANNGQEYIITRTGTGLVTVLTHSGDSVYGDISVLLTLQKMSLTFKAIQGGWIII